MLAVERHRELLKLLSRNGSVRTAEVARSLRVTEETVRRDFEKLEADGLLQRMHGGAVQLEANRREFPVTERARQHAAEKSSIARAALALLQAGQTIFLDASTTTLQVAHLLGETPLTVVTNSLQIATALAGRSSLKTIVLGGSLLPSSLSCAGWAAEQTLDLYHLDTAFFSCRGLDVERGLSDATEDQARLKRRVVDHASSAVLLADHSKVGVASSYFFARNCEIDIWITDIAPRRQVKSALTAQGVRVQIAPLLP